MQKKMPKKSGVVLFITLFTILVIVILANIVITIMSSQFRLTHHQVSRIQAYYAAQAGVNYALEMLRTGTWDPANQNQCPPGSTCPSPANPCCLTTIEAPTYASTFPHTVQDVKIVYIPRGQPGCPRNIQAQACIKATAIYTYTP